MSGSLSELMRDASNILVMGHKHSDLDSIGAAVGVCCAARALGRTAKIVVEREDAMCLNLIERMETLPEDADAFISPQDAMLMANGSTLLVIVDTNRPEQVESESLLLSCNSIALIDHHRRASEYIQNAALSFHEPYASSACELVTELLEYIVDPSGILRFEAEALLSGIVLDTKNFTLRTGGRTFDAAAFLRRAGADTTEVKTLLQTDMNSAMARYALIQRAKIYKKGIAVAAADTVQSRIIAAQAADELLNIAGVNASFVVFQTDNSVDISARSIGDVNVQLIVEKLGGGGTKATAGAQLQGAEIRDVVRRLLAAIDEYLAENE
jgi:c-di-AMP phosphodiesterase-like protein